MTTEEAQIDIASPVADEAVKSPVSPPEAVFKQWMFVEASKVTDAVAFLKEAFGAEEVERYVDRKRKADQEAPFPFIVELKTSGTTLTVADHKAFHVDGASKGTVFGFETEDVDAAVKKAEKAGATKEAINEGIDSGSRMGQVVDPFGHTWVITSPPAKEVVTEA